MTISELIESFRSSLIAAFPNATVEKATTVSAAIERVAAYSSSKPLLVLTPGNRVPLQTGGNLGHLGGVVRQTVQVWAAASRGIARRGEVATELADLVEEVEGALLVADGDWQDPRLEGSEPSQLPNGYPLDAWLIRVSVIKE